MLGGHVRDVQLIDRRTQRALLLAAGGAGDDDLIELHGPLGHREAKICPPNADGLPERAIADHANVHGHLTSTDSGDSESAGGVGHRAFASLVWNGDLCAR